MNFSKIQSQFDAAKSEIDQLKTGRKVSASRARAALMKVKKETDILRREILAHSKGLPVKPRKAKPSPAEAKTEVAEVPTEVPTEVVQPQPAEVAQPQPVAVAKPKTAKAKREQKKK